MGAKKLAPPKPKGYELLRECVEQGIIYGLARAYKYTDQPSRDILTEEIARGVMSELDDAFDLTEF